ncbi:hypothetical protein [Myroides profundi]|uniref:Lipoprotein n=1 Tax=Myroides profundi TaxID=480520 RepID=A0AAJ4W2X0_MYRPR|nr:hypothetical protein [Myroides profundi]AJH16281.1 hypothetical protein MPR_3155 [Myroides profundi]SEQ61177.1 hypothetical protein SAMN04488089_104199 [Myroides profundi]
MKKVGITLFALALLTVSCKDKEVKTEVVEETQIVTPQVQSETADLKLAADNMDAYMESEDKMMTSLGDADQLRLQKAIQIIGNMNVIYTEDDGIDHDKTDAAFLKEVGGKTFKEVCKVAEAYLKADQQREFDRINGILGSIKDPKADADVERYNEAQHDLKEANKIPITLDAYTYSEECFL